MPDETPDRKSRAERLLSAVENRLRAEDAGLRSGGPHIGAAAPPADGVDFGLRPWRFAPRRGDDGRPRFALGVSTWNRVDYARRFVDTFAETRSDQFAWTLIIADDGSTDGTLEYLRSLRIDDVDLVVIENKRATIAGQTNSVFLAAESLGFDFGFKADDDVFFVKEGWDSLYHDAVRESGFDHLVYHNREWKSATHDIASGPLRSSVAARDCMGCFYTFTPKLLTAVGYFDEANFPFRGHSHIDFTVRASRAGFNEEAQCWDADSSQEYISMWSRDEYVDLVDWNSAEVKEILSPEERRRRAEIIDQPQRVYVSLTSAQIPTPRRSVHLEPQRRESVVGLLTSPRFTFRTGHSREFDGIYVLNLRHERQKWGVTAEALSREGLVFERFPAVNGNLEVNAGRWRAYASEGLTTPEERKLNRKLIQSPGAWGYLMTMEQLISAAIDQRLRRILVFDDDIMLHRDFSNLFATAWHELPQGWKLVYLGCTPKDWTDANKFSTHLVHPGRVTDGSFAFALDSTAFELVLASIREYRRPFDAGALRSVARAFAEQTFAILPQLAVADVSTSAIRGNRDQERFAKKAGWDLDQYVPRGHALSSSTGDGLVTVLIVCEKGSAGLWDTFLSLRTQSHGEFEVLVLDNGTTDETAEILRRARAADSRLRLYRADRPLTELDAMNFLLGQASGAFLTVTAPGEVSHPTRFAACLGALRQSEASLGVAAPVAKTLSEPPAGIDDTSLLAAWLKDRQVGAASLRCSAGFTRRRVLRIAGGLLQPGEPGWRELIGRAHAAGAGSESIPLPGEPLAWQSARATSRVETRAEDGGASPIHDEIKKGMRPPLIAPELDHLEVKILP